MNINDNVIVFLGQISIAEWTACMEKVTNLKIPWRMLRDKLVISDTKTNKVQYMTTFDARNPPLEQTGVITLLNEYL